MTQSYSPLITPAELAARLDDPDLVVFDCRHSLGDPEAGVRAFAQGHIPGALFAHLDRDLSSPVGPGTGRHPLPDWETFTGWLGSRGVEPSTAVVAYDEMDNHFASRLWWLLRALGHERVSVLDGGYFRWRAEGRPKSAEAAPPRPAVYRGSLRKEWLVELDEVQSRLEEPGFRLIDARVEPRFEGREEPLDPVAGHIPGAVNLPFTGNLNDDDEFLPPDELRARIMEALGGTPPGEAVHYCGSGVTACHNLLAQEIAGLPPGRLYAGSWSQWCSDPARPMNRGAGSRG
ncbi:MAG: sulfurtransferase [Deltaproteobacteria bacterium]|nr:sulfurtransferase [Deltaproteobacteria bacterium]